MNTEILRSSFELIVGRNPEPTVRFYEILFERYPEARPLFGRNSSEAQATMLRDALVAVVDHLEDAAWLTDTLKALGAKHVSYEVTESMYPWVGDALLSTLAEVAADDWTPEVEAAWQEAYAAIQGLMLQGASEAAAAA